MKPFLENQGDLATRPSTADLAIVPSRSEGFGLTALEALFAGRTFLVTQTNGFGETVQNVLLQSKPWAVQILRNHISGLRLLKVSANQQLQNVKLYGRAMARITSWRVNAKILWKRWLALLVVSTYQYISCESFSSL